MKYMNINRGILANNAGISQRIPLSRMGEAEDIANAAFFFASDMASYINGAAIPVDCGAILYDSGIQVTPQVPDDHQKKSLPTI